MVVLSTIFSKYAHRVAVISTYLQIAWSAPIYCLWRELFKLVNTSSCGWAHPTTLEQTGMYGAWRLPQMLRWRLPYQAKWRSWLSLYNTSYDGQISICRPLRSWMNLGTWHRGSGELCRGRPPTVVASTQHHDQTTSATYAWLQCAQVVREHKADKEANWTQTEFKHHLHQAPTVYVQLSATTSSTTTSLTRS
jgi:hypothetical protein